MKTIVLQDRHAVLIHALLKRMSFTDATRTVNAAPDRTHKPDSTDECMRLYPATRTEVDAAICAVCDQLKYQLHS